MKILGIESTAHTLGIGICIKDKVIANIYDTYLPPEGILPREAAEHHCTVFPDVLNKALKTAHCKMDDIDVIAVAQGPGIGSPLSVGVTLGKFLAAYYNKPIIGVNHPYAHIKIAEMSTGIVKDAVIIYVSGGNSQILWQNRQGSYDILGETLDIGAGNLYDTFCRKVGIKPAHGGTLSKLAEQGKYIELPYTVKGMNLQFSGLLTAAINATKKHKIEDVAHSLMETSLYMIAEVAERAVHLKKAKAMLICGGVAQNRRLQEITQHIADENGLKTGFAPNEYYRDNGAMIAYAGWELYNKYGKSHDISKLKHLTTYRIDAIDKIVKAQLL
jgi:glycoprotease/Kae1 family metallohydrolase